MGFAAGLKIRIGFGWNPDGHNTVTYEQCTVLILMKACGRHILLNCSFGLNRKISEPCQFHLDRWLIWLEIGAVWQFFVCPLEFSSKDNGQYGAQEATLRANLDQITRNLPTADIFKALLSCAFRLTVIFSFIPFILGNVLQIVSAPGQYLRTQGSVVLPSVPAANAIRNQPQIGAPTPTNVPSAGKAHLPMCHQLVKLLYGISVAGIGHCSLSVVSHSCMHILGFVQYNQFCVMDCLWTIL